MSILARRTLVSALALVAATAALVACGGDEDASTPTSTAKTATSAATGTPRADATPAATTPAASPKAAVTGTAVAGASLVSVTLDPRSGSEVRGTATVNSTADGLALTVQAQGLRAGATYAALVRAGSCEAASASTGRLGTFVADASGSGRLTVTAAEASAAGATTPLTVEVLRDGPHAIELRGADGTLEACGVVPPLEAAGGGAGPGY